jgi:hypothetical protein
MPASLSRSTNSSNLGDFSVLANHCLTISRLLVGSGLRGVADAWVTWRSMPLKFESGEHIRMQGAPEVPTACGWCEYALRRLTHSSVARSKIVNTFLGPVADFRNAAVNFRSAAGAAGGQCPLPGNPIV